MFSLYTKRFLTLNLAKCILYYTKKNRYCAKDMTEIPLRVYFFFTKNKYYI